MTLQSLNYCHPLTIVLNLYEYDTKINHSPRIYNYNIYILLVTNYNIVAKTKTPNFFFYKNNFKH